MPRPRPQGGPDTCLHINDRILAKSQSSTTVGRSCHLPGHKRQDTRKIAMPRPPPQGSWRTSEYKRQESGQSQMPPPPPHRGAGTCVRISDRVLAKFTCLSINGRTSAGRPRTSARLPQDFPGLPEDFRAGSCRNGSICRCRNSIRNDSKKRSGGGRRASSASLRRKNWAVGFS